MNIENELNNIINQIKSRLRFSSIYDILYLSCDECCLVCEIHNPQSFCYKMIDKINVLNQFNTCIELNEYIQQKHISSCNIDMNIPDEFILLIYYLCFVLYKQPVHSDIINLFLQNEDFKLKSIIRLNLLLNNWNEQSIENLISNVFDIKDSNCDIPVLQISYIFIKNLINFENSKKMSKGRPKIPSSIEMIVYEKKKKKIKIE